MSHVQRLLSAGRALIVAGTLAFGGSLLAGQGAQALPAGSADGFAAPHAVETVQHWGHHHGWGHHRRHHHHGWGHRHHHHHGWGHGHRRHYGWGGRHGGHRHHHGHF
ncbi:hypothetical protein [Methylobacterium oryzihabitans]|uniref:Uncharacterized protein n=1 Tax=Methylobacterium oryzihabitans TaxID=2499852 RepID=A0A437NV99_9HYPH|nr:hypothetical protein [Methylobacterium oryzihabitans]RVU13791.1 hypothetical protein EOE48_26250 [Methylobacterium oryzihabitans]